MKAIILAAGFGIRLKSLTMHKPKSMVKVCGKPILEYQIDAYLNADIDEIIIVTGYKSEIIENFVAGKRYSNVKVVRNNDYAQTNNMYSLWLCREELKKSKQIFISNADVVFDYSIIKRIVKKKGDYIICEENSYNHESMKISLNSKGYINNISKEISSKISFGCSIDVYYLSHKSLNALVTMMSKIIKVEKDRNQWTEVALQALLKNNAIKAEPFVLSKDEKWYEVDTIEDLIQAELAFSTIPNRLRGKRNFIFDLDGTIYISNDVINGIPQFIKQLQKKGYLIKFLSNNSSKSKIEYVNKLKSMGIIVNEEQIVLSTDIALKYLLSNGYSEGFIVGTKTMENYLNKKGIKHTVNNPEFVLIGYDTELTYNKLEKASLFIYSGLPYFATHSDNFCPTPQGPIPDAGSIIKLLEITTNHNPKIFGKPEKEMMEYLVNDGDKIEDFIFIGDRLYTDFTMAKSVGVDFICVLSGETNREDIELEQVWPALIVNSASDLKNFI